MKTQKMSSNHDLDFSMAVVDGIFLKPFVHALGSMGVDTFFFIVNKEGLRLDQPNKLNGRLFVSWEARAEDFIFYDYESSEKELQVTVLTSDLGKALRSVQKKKSIMLFKYAGQNQLKISISETIRKPDRNHFPNSLSVPIHELIRPETTLESTCDHENAPIVSAEATHVCEEFLRLVQKHDDKKGSILNLSARFLVYRNAVVGLDPVEPEDGFYIGMPSGEPISEMELPLHLFVEAKKLSASTPDFSLIKFYYDDKLMMKCRTGNYGTLRLYFSHE